MLRGASLPYCQAALQGSAESPGAQKSPLMQRAQFWHRHLAQPPTPGGSCMHQADFAALRPDKSNSSDQTPRLGEKPPGRRPGAEPGGLGNAAPASSPTMAQPLCLFFSTFDTVKNDKKASKGREAARRGAGSCSDGGRAARRPSHGCVAVRPILPPILRGHRLELSPKPHSPAAGAQVTSGELLGQGFGCRAGPGPRQRAPAVLGAAAQPSHHPKSRST